MAEKKSNVGKICTANNQFQSNGVLVLKNEELEITGENSSEMRKGVKVNYFDVKTKNNRTLNVNVEWVTVKK